MQLLTTQNVQYLPQYPLRLQIIKQIHWVIPRATVAGELLGVVGVTEVTSGRRAMTMTRPVKFGLSLLVLALLGLVVAIVPAAASLVLPSPETIVTDPSNLMICPLGSVDLSACTLDPNHVGNNGFIVFYNSNGNDKPTIGNPFDVIVAIPEINGVPVSPAPTLGSTALYSAGAPVSVTATSGAQPLPGTFNTGDLYTFVFGSTVANNSWQFSNLQACDEAISPCVNPLSSPLTNVTGFEVFLWTINGNTPFFDATQFLTFTGSLPTGSFVTAFGLATETDKHGTTTEVPVEAAFTNGGLVVPGSPPVPEPATLALFGAGLVSIAALRKRTRRSK